MAGDYTEYILIAALILIPLVLIILEAVEKKIQEKVSGKDLSLEEIYLNKLKEIDAKDISLALENLKKLSVDFFKKKYDIEVFMGFANLADYFKKRGKIRENQFCEIMETYLYSKSKPDQSDIKNLIDLFNKILIMSKIENDNQNTEVSKEE